MRYPDPYGPPEPDEDPSDGDDDLWAEAAREQAQWEADAAAWQGGHDD